MVVACLSVSQVCAKTIYFNGGWSATPYAYVYYEVGTATEYLGKWPGTIMTATDDAGWYSVELPADISVNAVVIFNTNTGSDRYPADQEPGIAMPWLATDDEAGYYVLADKQWYSSIPAEKPVVTATPAGGRFTSSIEVSLSVNIEGIEIHYTLDGSEPSASSETYSEPFEFTATTTLKTYVVNEGNENIQTFTYTYVEDGGGTPTYPSLETAYYKTNPNGQRGSNRTINMVHANGVSSSALSTWTEDELIAQGVGNDICSRFLGGHEYPIYDVYALYAAYDADYLYLGCQYVNTSNADESNCKPYNSEIPVCIALDLDPLMDCSGAMRDGEGVGGNDKGPWQSGTQFLEFENGMDCLILFGAKTQTGTPGVFLPNADGKFSYDAAYCKNLDARAYQDGLLPSITSIYAKVDNSGEAFYAGPWGSVQVSDPNEYLQDESNYKDVISKWSKTGHTFYEIKVSLASLGISEDYIKTTGIGVMWISTHGTSATSSIPYDPTCFDNALEEYSKDPSTSQEKEDVDTFTYAMARVGGPEITPVEEVKADISVSPVVSANGRQVSVSGNEGNDVQAFDLLGNIVFAADNVEGDIVFDVPVKGAYVIVAGETVAKILAR